MQIVIQNSGVSEYNGRAIFDAAVELGIPTHGVGIVPFTWEFVGAENIDFSLPTFYYGSTRLLEIAKRDHDGPGVYFNSDFNVKGAHSKRDDLLNPNKYFRSIKHFVTPTFVYYWQKEVEKRPYFFRPHSALKTFAGMVLNKNNFQEGIQTIQECIPNHEEEIVCISEYKEIWAEWRFFVVDGSVVTGSLYKESGRLEMRPASKDMLMIAQAACTKWLPDPTCVIDLALTPDGLKVIEFNSINSSGTYLCDVKSILTAIQDLIG